MTTEHSSGIRPAGFTEHRDPSSAAIISVGGEIDFTNVDELIDAATEVADDSARVVLDLSDVEFFGSAGFSALYTLSERYCARAVTWAVVPSRNVDRVVRLCDRESLVPLRETVAAALESA